MPYFTTQDGCRIYYEKHGFDGLAPRRCRHLGLNQGKTGGLAFEKAEQKSSEPVVVFLNGTMQNTMHWKSAATVLKDRLPVLLYDARAQGRSDIGEMRLSLERHAADLAELLQHLKVSKAQLVGLSHGAKVALVCAADSHERIGRLVLCLSLIHI